MKYTKLFTIILFIAIFSISCGGGSIGSSGADSSGGGEGSSIATQMEALRSIDAVIDNMDVMKSDPAFASANLLQLPSMYKEAEPPDDGGDDDEEGMDDGFQSGVITAQILRHNALQAFMRSEVFLRFLEASLEAGEISADDVAGLSGHIAGLLSDGKLSIEAISNEYETDKFEVLVNACSSGTPHNRLIIRPSDGVNKTKVIFLGETDEMWIRAVALVGDSKADTKIMGCVTDRESYFNCMEFHFDNIGNGVTNLAGNWIGIDKEDDPPISISGMLTSSVGWTDTNLWIEEEEGSFGISGKISTPDGDEVKDVQELPNKPDGIMNLSEMIAENNLLSGIDLFTPLNGANLGSIIAMNSADISTLFRSWNGELQSCPSPEGMEELPSDLERAARVAAVRHNDQRKPEKDSRAMLEAFRGSSSGGGNDGCDGISDDGFCFPSLSGSIDSCDQIVGEYFYTGDDGDFNTITMSEWLGAEHMNPDRIYHYTIEGCYFSDDGMTLSINEGGVDPLEAISADGDNIVFKIRKDDDDQSFFTSRYLDGGDVAPVPFTCKSEESIINSNKFSGDNCTDVHPFVSAKVRIQQSEDGHIEFFLYNLRDALGGEATDTLARFRMDSDDGGGGWPPCDSSGGGDIPHCSDYLTGGNTPYPGNPEECPPGEMPNYSYNYSGLTNDLEINPDAIACILENTDDEEQKGIIRDNKNIPLDRIFDAMMNDGCGGGDGDGWPPCDDANSCSTLLINPACSNSETPSDVMGDEELDPVNFSYNYDYLVTDYLTADNVVCIVEHADSETHQNIINGGCLPFDLIISAMDDGCGGDDSPEFWGAAYDITSENACEMVEGMYAYLHPGRDESKSSSDNLIDWFDYWKLTDMGIQNNDTPTVPIYESRLCIVCDHNDQMYNLSVRDCSNATTLHQMRTLTNTVLNTSGNLEINSDDDGFSYIQNLDGITDGPPEDQRWIGSSSEYTNPIRYNVDPAYSMSMYLHIEKTNHVYYGAGGYDGDVHMYLHKIWDANADIADDSTYNGSNGSIHNDIVFDFVRVTELPEITFCYNENNIDDSDPRCSSWLQGTDGDGVSCDYYVDGETVVAPDDPSDGETFDYDIIDGYFQSELGLDPSVSDELIGCLVNYQENDQTIRDSLRINQCIPVELLEDGVETAMDHCKTELDIALCYAEGSAPNPWCTVFLSGAGCSTGTDYSYTMLQTANPSLFTDEYITCLVNYPDNSHYEIDHMSDTGCMPEAMTLISSDARNYCDSQ